MHEAGHVEKDQPWLAADDVETDGRQHQTAQDRKHRLGYVVRTQTDERGESQKHQGEFFRRPEAKRELCKRRRKQGEKDDRNRAADERGSRRGHKGDIGLPLGCQWPAIKDRGDSRRSTGYAQGYRADRTAIHGAVVDRSQEDDRGVWRYQKGKRQQDGNAVHGPQTRQRADEQANHDPDHKHDEIDRLKGLAEPTDQVADDVFHTPSPGFASLSRSGRRAGRTGSLR